MVKWFVITTFIVFHLLVHALAQASGNVGPGRTVGENRRVTNTLGSDGAATSENTNPRAGALSELDQLSQEIADKCVQNGTQPGSQPFNDCVDGELSKSENAEKIKRIQQQGFARDNELNPTYNNKSTTQVLLQEALSKKTDKSLRGEDGKRLVAHSDFYTLYNVQLTKAITMTINSYCLYADENASYTISPDQTTRDARRADNLKKVTQQTDADGQAAVSKYFSSCLSELDTICDWPADNSSLSSLSEAVKNYSQPRACATKIQLRKLNKAIATSRKRSNELKDYNNNQGFDQANLEGGELLEFYDSRRHDSFDDITSFSAKQFNEEVLTKVEELKTSCNESNLSGDSCGTFGNNFDELTDEQIAKMAASHRIQTVAIKDSIGEYTDEKENDDSFYEQLRLDGYDEEKIDGIVQADIEIMKNRLKEKYEKERNVALKEFVRKIKKERDDKTDPNLDVEAYNQSLTSTEYDKAEEINSLILFNNFVSAYLKKGEGNDAVYNLSAIEADIDSLEDSGVALFQNQGDIEAARNVYRDLESSNTGNRNPSSAADGVGTLNSEDINCKVLKDYNGLNGNNNVCN